jgi:hypothetical protein
MMRLIRNKFASFSCQFAGHENSMSALLLTPYGVGSPALRTSDMLKDAAVNHDLERVRLRFKALVQKIDTIARAQLDL